MGGKNCRGNAALARPSTEYFQKIKLDAAAKAAAEAAPTPEFDLSVLPNHPALTIVDNKFIQINIECNGTENQRTNVGTLITTLAAYAPYVQFLQLKIHAPYPHLESWVAQKTRTQLFKKLFIEINNFELCNLNLTMILDEEKFPQMKLAAGVMGLNFFRGWNLMYEVIGISDYVLVPRGSEIDLRLRGVFKKEVLKA
ncbi:hypothetical protein EAF04_004342 [Stromatinia cepivora]|nr:hypothetical protein EAF04_004342 [Stromatinia cepivora]